MARVDVVSVLGNQRMLPSAIAPPCAVFGVTLVSDTPVSWPVAFLPAAIVALICVDALVRQRSLDKPAKVWRGAPWRSFVLDTLAIVAAMLGLFYATEPWVESFDVKSTLGIGAGCAIAGGVICAVSLPVWILLARRGEGPMKKPRQNGTHIIFGVMNIIFLGPVAGYFGTMPLTFLYIEEVASANPSFMTRHGWLLVLTLLMTLPVAAGWAYYDLRRRLAKLANSRTKERP